MRLGWLGDAQFQRPVDVDERGLRGLQADLCRPAVHQGLAQLGVLFNGGIKVAQGGAEVLPAELEDPPVHQGASPVPRIEVLGLQGLGAEGLEPAVHLAGHGRLGTGLGGTAAQHRDGRLAGTGGSHQQGCTDRGAGPTIPHTWLQG